MGRLTWWPWLCPRAARSSGASGRGRSSGSNRGGGAQGAAAPRNQVARGRTRAPTRPAGPSSASSPAMARGEALPRAQRTRVGTSAGGRGPPEPEPRAAWAGPEPREPFQAPPTRPAPPAPEPPGPSRPRPPDPPLRNSSGTRGGRGGLPNAEWAGPDPEALAEFAGREIRACSPPLEFMRRGFLPCSVGYKSQGGSPDSRESKGVRLLRRDGKWRGHVRKAYGMGNIVVTIFEKYSRPQYLITIN